jgi:hypothetical protein
MTCTDEAKSGTIRNSLEKSSIPWVKADGTECPALLSVLQNKVLSTLMQRPGSDLPAIYTSLPMLSLDQTSTLLKSMITSGLIYERQSMAYTLQGPFDEYPPRTKRTHSTYFVTIE